MPSQNEYNVSLQANRNTYVKVELMDYNYIILDSLEGNLLSGSVTIDSESDVRRTCRIEMVVGDASFDVGTGGKIWLNRLIKISVGVDDMHSGDTIWTNLGIFLINSPTYSYDATTSNLNFEGVDLMALMTGMRNGYLTGITYEVPQGSNVRDVIIAVLKENGFTQYVVSECRNVDGALQNVPNDMEWGQGATWYDILANMRDILPNYQIYFDTNGVFHYEPIPASASDPILVDTEVWDENVISEGIPVNFEDIKNVVEVYGATHEALDFSTKTTVSGSSINLTLPDFEELKEYNMVGWTLADDVSGTAITLTVNDTLGPHPLVNMSGGAITSLAKDTFWVAIYQADDTWLFLGHQQAQAVAKNENPESPFYVGAIGEIKIVLYGGDYANISSDELAQQRAEYEIYKRCQLNDAITVTSVPIYWLDVNWKTRYRQRSRTDVYEYSIKNITMGLTPDDTATITLNRFYPYYENY